MTEKEMNNKGLHGSIFNLADRILSFCERVEAISGKRPEICATVLYAVLHLFMAIFHEPWYDEAVAWQIARCASVRDILFEIPHYEGHPPLWHLILVPFAKLGAPYELALTLISLSFAGFAVCLIIWKSPFPRFIRLLLPFTYFFFYQYGVICRPYCVMMLAFMLLAINYPNRNDKPGCYTLSLALLCLTSAYGIVIAGGLAIVWVWEIWNRRSIISFVKSFLVDKRIWWLVSLLAVALVLIAGIIPRGETFATNLLSDSDEGNGALVCLTYMLLGSVPDVCLTSLYSTYGLLQLIEFELYSLIPVCLAGLIIWSIAIEYGRKKGTVLLLLIPYSLYAVFAALVYISPHHIGIGLLLIVFWLWVSIHCNSINVSNEIAMEQRLMNKKVASLLFALIMGISLFWNISSCIIDMVSVYEPGREEAAFIKEHGLDQYSIMTSWDVFYDDEDEITAMDINHAHCADNVSPYFDENIFLNFNDGRDDLCYSTHIWASDDETRAKISAWSKKTPDVLFMHPPLEIVYDDITLSDYQRVYSRVYSKVWKGQTITGRAEIHVRNELAQEMGLEEVERDYPFLVDLLTWFR